MLKKLSQLTNILISLNLIFSSLVPALIYAQNYDDQYLYNNYQDNTQDAPTQQPVTYQEPYNPADQQPPNYTPTVTQPEPTPQPTETPAPQQPIYNPIDQQPPNYTPTVEPTAAPVPQQPQSYNPADQQPANYTPTVIDNSSTQASAIDHYDNQATFQNNTNQLDEARARQADNPVAGDAFSTLGSIPDKVESTIQGLSDNTNVKLQQQKTADDNGRLVQTDQAFSNTLAQARQQALSGQIDTARLNTLQSDAQSLGAKLAYNPATGEMETSIDPCIIDPTSYDCVTKAMSKSHPATPNCGTDLCYLDALNETAKSTWGAANFVTLNLPELTVGEVKLAQDAVNVHNLRSQAGYPDKNYGFNRGQFEVGALADLEADTKARPDSSLSPDELVKRQAYDQSLRQLIKDDKEQSANLITTLTIATVARVGGEVAIPVVGSALNKAKGFFGKVGDLVGIGGTKTETKVVGDITKNLEEQTPVFAGTNDLAVNCVTSLKQSTFQQILASIFGTTVFAAPTCGVSTISHGSVTGLDYVTPNGDTVLPVNDNGLIGVFDGVSGGRHPELASTPVAEAFWANLGDIPLHTDTKTVEQAMYKALNDAPLDVAQNQATTAVVAKYFVENDVPKLTVAQVGDSPFLIIDKDGKILQKIEPVTPGYSNPGAVITSKGIEDQPGAVQAIPTRFKTFNIPKNAAYIINVSDGVADNGVINTTVLKKLINDSGGDPQALAEAMTELAKLNAINPSAEQLGFKGADDVSASVMKLERNSTGGLGSGFSQAGSKIAKTVLTAAKPAIALTTVALGIAISGDAVPQPAQSVFIPAEAEPISSQDNPPPALPVVAPGSTNGTANPPAAPAPAQPGKGPVLVNQSIRQDCDTNLGYKVNIESWYIEYPNHVKEYYEKPGTVTNIPCGDPKYRQYLPQRLTECAYSQCDINTKREVCLEQWVSQDTGIPYTKPGAVTGKDCDAGRLHNNVPKKMSSVNIPMSNVSTLSVAKSFLSFSLSSLLNKISNFSLVTKVQAQATDSTKTTTNDLFQVNSLMSQRSFSTNLTAQQVKDKLLKGEKVTSGDVVDSLAQNMIIQPLGARTKDGIIVMTGGDGTVSFDLNPGLYNVKVSPIPEVDITSTSLAEVKTGLTLLYVGVSEGKGNVKQSDIKDKLIALYPKANFSKVKAIVFYDKNQNGQLDTDEKIVPWAGVRVVLQRVDKDQHISLKAGWNLISLNALPSEALTAKSLIEQINSQGGQASAVSTLENSFWKSYVMRDGQSYSGDDFPIELGKAYFVKALKTSILSFKGQDLVSPLKLSLNQGWNAIGMPKSSKTYQAKTLIIDLVSNQVDQIDRWESGLWDTFLLKSQKEYGNNFPIENSRGYILKVNSQGEFTP